MDSAKNPVKDDLRVWLLSTTGYKVYRGVSTPRYARVILDFLESIQVLFSFTNSGLEIYTGSEWLEWEDGDGNSIHGVCAEDLEK